MRKVSTVIGQNVVSLADGHQIASVKDVVIGDSHESVVALVLQEAGLLSDARIVPIGAVRSYGRDAVVIESDDAVVEGGAEPDIPNESARTLAGMKVLSSAGEQVGTIADAYFEEEDGRIVGFEVSSGMVDDMASGRRFLPVDELDHIGDEIVYVRPEAAQSLGPVPGGSTGAIGALEDVKAKAGEVVRAAGDKASEVGAKVEEAMPADGEGQDERTPGSDLEGKRAGADVEDSNGRIIVANGQLITSEHVDRASAAGQSDALRVAADRWSAAERDRVISGTIEQVTDSAGSTWDRFTRMIAELTDETGKRASEQQTKVRLAAINDAVGRPVTKVILDRSDDVTLNLGDIITHEAVQRSHDAGTLDTLLASVYKGEVTFERDEMKAAAEGTSTVEKASGGSAVVDELQSSVESAQAEHQRQSDEKRREEDEARERRDAERQERAQAREEAAQRAGAGEPLPEEGRPSEDATQSSGRSRSA